MERLEKNGSVLGEACERLGRASLTHLGHSHVDGLSPRALSRVASGKPGSTTRERWASWSRAPQVKSSERRGCSAAPQCSALPPALNRAHYETLSRYCSRDQGS